MDAIFIKFVGRITSFFLLLLCSNLHANFLLRTDKPDQTVQLINEKNSESWIEAIFRSSGARQVDAGDETIHEVRLKTKTGVSVPVVWYDRGSKTVIIVGQGFPGKKEAGHVIARLFPDFDVVLFDYRWTRLLNFAVRPSTFLHPINQLFLKEDEEVKCVVKYIKSLRNFDQIIGLGQCYSSFTFAKAQYCEQKEGNQLFSKLVFDSCWYSFHQLGKQFARDPLLLFDAQNGGTPREIKMLLNSTFVKFFTDNLIQLFVPNVSIVNYLKGLKNTPILFIHGMNDLLIPFKTVFEHVWNGVMTRKAAFITPYAHSENIQEGIIYKHVLNHFISASSIDKFVSTILRAVPKS